MPKQIERVTAVQASRLTGLSERTIRRRIGKGVLRATKDEQGHHAIRVDDLMALTTRELTTLDAALLRIEALEAEQASQAERMVFLEQRVWEYEQRPGAPVSRSLGQFVSPSPLMSLPVEEPEQPTDPIRRIEQPAASQYSVRSKQTVPLADPFR